MVNRETRTPRSEEDEGRRPYARQKKDRTPIVVGGVLLVAVVAIGTAGFLNREKAAEAAPGQDAQPEDPYTSPFGDIAAEEGPKRMSPGGGPSRRVGPTSPEGLLSEPVWTAAVKEANAALALAKEAEAAKESGDNDTFLSKATRARKQMDAAIIATADWEMEIQEQYGDTDPRVRKVGRERDRWFELLRKYHGLRED